MVHPISVALDREDIYVVASVIALSILMPFLVVKIVTKMDWCFAIISFNKEITKLQKQKRRTCLHVNK